LWGAPEDGGDPVACVANVVREAHPDVLALLEVSAEDVKKLSADLGLRCAHTPYREGGDAMEGASRRVRPATGGVCARGKASVSSTTRTGTTSSPSSRLRGGCSTCSPCTSTPTGSTSRAASPAGLPARKTSSRSASRSRASPARQSDQSAALLDRIGRLKDPTVIAGDFNSTRDAALHHAMRAHLTDAWEQSGFGFGGTVHLFEWLPLRVDHIYTSADFAVREATVPEAGCSDHLPVVADLVLRAETPR
jgi:endonuclease/exonuclease/phosphatase family metal-dependent hydrolase